MTQTVASDSTAVRPAPVLPKVSVIVPIGGQVRDYISDALASVVGQTLHDIEIICIDDASTDGSGAILREYAAKDARIRTLCHENNLGLSQSRKDGVAASTGTYVMFLDADDMLKPDACEKAYAAIERYHTDMVQFDTEVENLGRWTDQEVQDLARFLRPSLGRLNYYGSNLTSGCWRDRLFGFTIFNKIYRGDLCRQAFLEVRDGQYPIAQDLYAFFLICYHAETYYGIADVLYHYRTGTGVSGAHFVTPDQFQKTLTEKSVYEAIVAFLSAHDELSEYEDMTAAIRHDFITRCVSIWSHRLRPEHRSAAFGAMADTWGFEDILTALIAQDLDHREVLAERMAGIRYFQAKRSLHAGKRPLSIAIYSPSGSQEEQQACLRVAGQLAAVGDYEGNALYHVVLLSDAGQEAVPAAASARFGRETLPAWQPLRDSDYRKRFERWQQIIAYHHVDLVISGSWNGPADLWDMLCVKGQATKPLYIIRAGGYTCAAYQDTENTAAELIGRYRIADGVVTLSATDQYLASLYNRNTVLIGPPLTFDPRHAPVSQFSDNDILWVGEMLPEKNPLEAVEVVRQIAARDPDVHMDMIGGGPLLEEVRQAIARYHLDGNITVVPETEDRGPYYESASLLICTSSLESDPVPFGEAMSHAVPVLTYDMPWLSYLRDARGLLAVPVHRDDLLAAKAIDLLGHPMLAKAIGQDGKRQALARIQEGSTEKWRRFFELVLTQDPEVRTAAFSEPAMVIRSMTDFQRISHDSSRQREKDLKEQIDTISFTSFLARKAKHSLSRRNREKTVRLQESLSDRLRQLLPHKSRSK